MLRVFRHPKPPSKSGAAAPRRFTTVARDVRTAARRFASAAKVMRDSEICRAEMPGVSSNPRQYELNTDLDVEVAIVWAHNLK